MGLRRKMERCCSRPLNKEVKRQQERQFEMDKMATQLSAKINEERFKAEVRAFYKMAVLTNWVLHENFGFGGRGENSRLQRFQDEMARLCSCVHDGKCDISVEGLNQTLKEETGYDTIWHLNHRRYGADGSAAK